MKERLRLGQVMLVMMTLLLFAGLDTIAQKGVVMGTVSDGITNRLLTGVDILNNRNGKTISVSMADGMYTATLDIGDYSIAFRLQGFRKKIINGLRITAKKTTQLNILLYPQQDQGSGVTAIATDSSRAGDTAVTSVYAAETAQRPYNISFTRSRRLTDLLSAEHIGPGNFENGLAVAKGLGGVIVQQNPADAGIQSFIISGMGERYNQLLYNGALLNSFDPLHKAFPLELLPAEAISEVNVQGTGDAGIPADVAGGTVAIKTKDRINSDFFYIRAGAGLSANTTNQPFFKDESSGSWQLLGLPGSQRALPEGFPTTRSQYAFSSKNVQEQVYLSSLLKNNGAPVSAGDGKPDERVVLGFGKNWRKKDVNICLTGFIQQGKKEQFTESYVQTAPDISRNPYPFTGSIPLIHSSSRDSNYYYQSHLTAVINASAIYRKSKISFRNFMGSQFTSTFTRRSNIYKPDEDTLAHTGLYYLSTQQYFINTQLSGEHALGDNAALRLEWQASYTYFNEQHPDERNLLLRKDASAGNLFALAMPTNAQGFTNSGRLWRNSKENNFSAFIHLQFPFSVYGQTQLLNGGIALQENYRVLNADLLFVQGPGYVTYDKLLAPERYYPGGIALSTYYVNNRKNPISILQNDRGNYNASGSLGASWLQLDARLNRHLIVNAGVRAETNSQLATNVYYQYASGFKNPQAIALDENTRITSFNILPSAKLVYSTSGGGVSIFTAWSRTVNRPQLQELVKYAYYDGRSFMVTTGNGLLATAIIDNYNAGISLVPDAYSHFRISGFFKKIDQPIEYVVSSYSEGITQLTPHNTGPAEVKGLEAAFRLKLNFANKPWLNGITLFANANISSSTVKAAPLRSTNTASLNEHSLSGSPNYATNGGLLMQYARFPQITVLYNRTGDYLTAVGSGALVPLPNGHLVSAMPGYRVKGREQLDVQVAQQVWKGRIQLIAGVKNLAGGDFTTYQDLNGNKKFDGPLVLINKGNQGGYFVSGTDNAISSIRVQRTYYFTLSCLFY